MTKVTNEHGIWSGVCDDGRYRYVDVGSFGRHLIEGRDAIQGFYVNEFGGIDTSKPVDAADWQAVSVICDAVVAARLHDSDNAREREYAWQDARDRVADEVAKVRGGPLDRNTW